MRHLYTDHRKVLLIDSNVVKQTLRANVLRNHEVEVDTASGMDDAERFWTAHAYDLVLLAAQESSDEAATLTKKVREVRPAAAAGASGRPPTLHSRDWRLRAKSSHSQSSTTAKARR